MATEIRFGLIGLGLMGREFASAAARWSHLTNADARPILTAACDTNEGAFGWFKQNVSTLEFTTNDYHELLQREDVQAIYCAVPHHLHAQFYTDIIRAGKHLLGEKTVRNRFDRQPCDSTCDRREPWSFCSMLFRATFFPGRFDFEFGFTDSILQMWAAFCDELTNGREKMKQPFYCVSPEETHQSHLIFTQALESYDKRA